jgi:hypothetical protein
MQISLDKRLSSVGWLALGMGMQDPGTDSSHGVHSIEDLTEIQGTVPGSHQAKLGIHQFRCIIASSTIALYIGGLAVGCTGLRASDLSVLLRIRG